jgi:hypothetical protein
MAADSQDEDKLADYRYRSGHTEQQIVDDLNRVTEYGLRR